MKACLDHDKGGFGNGWQFFEPNREVPAGAGNRADLPAASIS
jgi:hypothetical protein